MSTQFKDLFKEQNQFNMAVIYLERLDRRMDECQIASTNGELLKWYRILRSVYRMLQFKILEFKDQKEDKVLLDMFKDAKNKLSTQIQGDHSIASEQYRHLTLTRTEEILEDIETRLYRLAYKYKMIFPDRVSKIGEKNTIRFIEMYVKKSVMKRAIEDPNYLNSKTELDEIEVTAKDPEEMPETEINTEDEDAQYNS